MDQANDTNKEIMELGHDPVPGYKPVFYVVFTVACVYLTALVVLYT